MKFYVIDYRAHPPSEAEFPCVILVRNSWDDYGYRTLFRFQLWNREKYIDFEHDVKILHRHARVTDEHILSRFETLGDDFCSLGQSVEFYKDVGSLPEIERRDILLGIRDVVYDENINTELFGDGFETSLLRFSEAEKSYNEGGQFIGKGLRLERLPLHFSFVSKVRGASRPHEIDFDFTPTVLKRERITALIGANGTGKTQILARLANTISGYEPKQGKLVPSRPRFGKIIAVSYSAFDSFSRPPIDDELYSYVYCGIMEDESIKNRQQILGELVVAVGEIVRKKRQDIWRHSTSLIFAESESLSESILTDPQRLSGRFSRMSSGQRVLMLVLSQMICELQDESLILFDEPEMHLHPNWISALAVSLHRLLESFNSYAIIATHSPILLQEIPSKSVRVFRRYGDVPEVTGLSVESFGENLTDLTNEIFERSEDDENYQKIMREWAKGLDIEDVLGAFGNKLGFNARANLAVAYSESNRSG